MQQVQEQAAAPVLGKVQQRLGEGGNGGREGSINNGANIPNVFGFVTLPSIGSLVRSRSERIAG